MKFVINIELLIYVSFEIKIKPVFETELVIQVSTGNK